jgi:hypothetical protein
MHPELAEFLRNLAVLAGAAILIFIHRSEP